MNDDLLILLSVLLSIFLFWRIMYLYSKNRDKKLKSKEFHRLYKNKLEKYHKGGGD